MNTLPFHRDRARARPLRQKIAFVGGLLLVSACSTPPETEPNVPACTLGELGDPALDPQMELIALGPDGISKPIQDGDTIALILPPQGGRVVFAGVRATNMHACRARLTGVLRDLTSKQIRLDDRTVNLKPYGNGWGGSVDSDISTFANIPLCPNQWSATDVFGTEYELEVILADSDKRTVSQKIRVTPVCAEPEYEAQCACICKGGYVLGEMCASGADAGAEAGLP